MFMDPLLTVIPSGSHFSTTLVNFPQLVIGGVFNISLGATKSWREKVISDPLIYSFHDSLISVPLTGLAPLEIRPTWHNKQNGLALITKGID